MVQPNLMSAFLDTATQINYSVPARREKLKLMEGDSETFVDVINLLGDYDGRFRL
jgi:hypothetical protein